MSNLSVAMEEEVDYDDDGWSDLDGCIIKHFYSNKTCFIAYSHYNINYIFNDLDEGDNVRLTISKNE